MALTGNDVKAALAAVGAVGGQYASFDTIAAGANSALASAPAGLTVQGAAAFLATLTQESAFLRATEEYAKNGRYAPYIGRTLEMITWSSNYAGFGAWCKAKGLVSDANTFVKNPKSLADTQWAWLGGVWFFQQNGLWKYANAGNFLAVSQGVNGGNGTIGTSFVPAGYATRLKMYNVYVSFGKALLPSGTVSAPVSSTSHADTGQNLNAYMSVLRVKQLQSDTLGFKGSNVDGIAGPQTVKALETKAGYASVADGKLPKSGSAVVRKMQVTLNISEITKAKLTVDGILGPQTGAQIEKYMHGGGRFVNLAKMGTSMPPAKPAAPTPAKFPLAAGNFYGVNDNTIYSHSGVRGGADKINVAKIQKKVGATADGIFGSKTKTAVEKFQKAHKLSVDGKVGKATWAALGL